MQDRINDLKKKEKEEYDKNKIKEININELLGDIDPKNILYDPALLDWDDLEESE